MEPRRTPRTHFRYIDVLLLLMTVIWGTNYAIVKRAFTQIDPQAFNGLRMLVSSSVFLAVILAMRVRATRDAERSTAPAPSTPGGQNDSVESIFYSPERINRREWLALAALGIVGQCIYQYCFVSGLAQTSVANSSLLAAAAPVLIALMTAALGQDRIGALHWLGAVLSFAGVYVVVAGGAALGGSSLRGDLTMFAAVCCWAIYTLGARPLMVRHSPVGVTGLSMAIGTALYVPLVLPHLRSVHWSQVSRGTWIAIVYSALFALCVSYTIWYAAVREIGSARTAVYSNLVPLVAIATGVIALGEPLGLRKAAGAAAVLIGVALTRVGAQRIAVPAEQ